MFEALLASLARALGAAAVPYMVIGGQAVLVHGEPRLTRDVDVTLGVAPDRLADILAVADQIGLVPLVEPETFVAETLAGLTQVPSGLRGCGAAAPCSPRADPA